MDKAELVVLNLFFLDSMRQFHVRELARDTKLDTKTVMKYLRKFVNRKIVLRKKLKSGFPFYEANRHSALYRYEKSQAVIQQIYSSNIIEFLEKELKPKVMILFGSIRKGTYYGGSDIDIFIQADKKRIDLSRFERKFGHKIQLLFEKDLSTISKGLLQNIYNGIVISGELEL